VLVASKDKVSLKLEEVGPDEHALREAIASGNYQLAYWHYDYPDETYWLGPLLGRPLAGPSGNNPMNYHGTLVQGLVEKMQAQREFEKVEKEMQRLHGVLDGEMPLIPLWQLDCLSAYREELEPVPYHRSWGPRKEVEKVPFDPLLVFPDVENWRLKQ